MATENVNIQLIIDTASSAKNLGQLKTGLKDLRKAFDEAEIGSENFYKIADALDETVEKTRTLKNGVDNIKQFQAAGSVLTNTFALATSSIAAFASENEDLQKNLLKVQSALGIAQSFGELADEIGKARSAGVALNATLLTNPFVLVAAAVVGLTAAIILFSDESSNAILTTDELTLALNDNAEAAKNVENAYNSQKKGIIDIISLFKEYGFNVFAAKSVVDDFNKNLQNSLIISEREKILLKEREQASKEYNDALEKIKDTQLSINLLKEKDISEDRIRQLRLEGELAKKNGASELEVKQNLINIERERIRSANEVINLTKDYRTELKSQEDALTNVNLKILDVISSSDRLKEEKEKLIEIEKTNSKIFESGSEFEIKIAKQKEQNQKQQISFVEEQLKKSQKELESAKAIYQVFVEQNNIIQESQANLKLLNFEYKNQSTNLKDIADEILRLNEIKDEFNKKRELRNIKNIGKEYKDLVDIKQQELAVMKEIGASETTINIARVKQIKDLINANNSAIIAIENSGLSYEETADATEQYRDEIKKLLRELQILEIRLNKFPNDLTNLLEEQKKYFKQINDDISRIGAQITQGATLISDAVKLASENRIRTLENEKNASVSILDDQLNQQLLSQSEYENKKANIQIEFDKKVKKEKQKAAIAQKAADIAQATINTAVAVTRTLSELGATPLGIGLAATAGVLGAVQIGLIAAQPLPEFAKGGVFEAAGGGMVKGAGNGTSDSINARLSNGESILNAKSTEMFFPLISAMNQLGGGISFSPETKIVKSNISQQNKTITKSDNLNIDVRISEAEITTVQNKIKKLNARTTF